VRDDFLKGQPAELSAVAANCVGQILKTEKIYCGGLDF